MLIYGIAMFVFSLYCFRAQSKNETGLTTSAQPTAGSREWYRKETPVWLLVSSVIAIGTGSYLAGNLKHKGSHNLTLDFTNTGTNKK